MNGKTQKDEIYLYYSLCENMRPPIWHLTEIIRQILKVDKDIDVQEIYVEIRTRIPLSKEQQEPTYGGPSYHHSTRRLLSDLVKRGEAIRVKRGVYRKAANIPSKSTRK